MDIKNVSFLTEITDEDVSHVNGGYYIYDFEIYIQSLEDVWKYGGGHKISSKPA